MPQNLGASIQFEFTGKMIHWRGPAPWFFVAMPEAESGDMKALSKDVTYGWGAIPVRVRIGGTTFTTSLFPKDNLYLVPVKASVRTAESLEEGDDVPVLIEVEL